MYCYGKNTHELLDQVLKDNPSVKKSFILVLTLVKKSITPLSLWNWYFYFLFRCHAQNAPQDSNSFDWAIQNHNESLNQNRMLAGSFEYVISDGATRVTQNFYKKNNLILWCYKSGVCVKFCCQCYCGQQPCWTKRKKCFVASLKSSYF